MVQRIAALLLFWMVSILVTPVWAEQEPINVGLAVHLPLFMWDKNHPTIDSVNQNQEMQRRWRYAEADLNIVQKIGAGWVVVSIRQWRDTPDDLLRVRRVIDQHRARGLKVVFRLLEEHAVYGRLTMTEDSTSGYDHDYYKWVRQLAERFGS
ncbi:MAG TPA: hypothetical protein PKI23_10840, partial [Pseudomonadales bacterium]|nr:hypothetical protein [Pseudomonadales bacterium]